MLAEKSTATIVGLDLGDRHSHLCLIDAGSGEILEEGRLRTTPEVLECRFGFETSLREGTFHPGGVPIRGKGEEQTAAT